MDEQLRKQMEAQRIAEVLRYYQNGGQVRPMERNASLNNPESKTFEEMVTALPLERRMNIPLNTPRGYMETNMLHYPPGAAADMRTPRISTEQPGGTIPQEQSYKDMLMKLLMDKINTADKELHSVYTGGRR
jgi:hypothetical protein